MIFFFEIEKKQNIKKLHWQDYVIAWKEAYSQIFAQYT